ncbi:MAG: dephospho-CoA kinase [Clostridia bacterium]|nr:dephospho-CoA kinase [Clostridia bacterium]
MKIIGITGGTGAGKSVLSGELKRRGAKVIDADLISRRITASGGAAYEEILKNFGREILGENGEIDRKLLGGIVFNNPERLELLEKITHKYIFEEMQKELDSCNEKIAVLDVPLLFQCDFPIKCDITVAVVADTDVRIARIMNRDNISKEAALSRMKNQLTNDEYTKLADVCFENNGDFEKLKEFADRLLTEL